MVEQQVRDTVQQTAPPPQKAKQPATKRKPGRPKGSKNKDKTQVTLTAELELIKTMVLKLLLLINGHFPLTYLVLDGVLSKN